MTRLWAAAQATQGPQTPLFALEAEGQNGMKFTGANLNQNPNPALVILCLPLLGLPPL